MTMFASHRQPPKSWIKPLDGWVMDMQARNLTPNTIETHWYRITAFAMVCNKSPKRVTSTDVQAWMTSGGWSAVTRAGRRATINEFYKYCVRTRYCLSNPVDSLPPIKRPKQAARQPAQEEAVAKGIWSEDTETRLMVKLGAEVGLRRAEISQVKGSDVVTYPPADDGRRLYGLIVRGKGGKTRIVPICEDLANEIVEQAGEGWLFPGRFGGHCVPDHVYRVVKRATGYPTHSFRRRFGRIAYEVSDHDLRGVQELLGHESPVTTQSYIFVPATNLGAIARKVRDRRPVDGE